MCPATTRVPLRAAPIPHRGPREGGRTKPLGAQQMWGALLSPRL